MNSLRYRIVAIVEEWRLPPESIQAFEKWERNGCQGPEPADDRYYALIAYLRLEGTGYGWSVHAPYESSAPFAELGRHLPKTAKVGDMVEVSFCLSPSGTSEPEID